MAVDDRRSLWFRVILAGFFACALTATAPLAALQQPAEPVAPAVLTVEEQEAFLRSAKVVRERGVSKGITGTIRATLSDGRTEHDASIQSIDEFAIEFKSNRGTEFNFRDSWRYNVAAYRLDRLLALGMTPISIERRHRGKPSSFTWWVDNVMMDEAERLKKKTSAPDILRWNQQMWLVRMFDQLIYNVDRNLGNLVIDKDWTIWMIDHSRAFRLFDKLKSPDNLARIDRQVFDRLRALDAPTLKETMGEYLTGPEQKALLARRDVIVQFFEKAGPGAFFNRPATATVAAQ